jgi:hypothetical protein
MAKALNEADIFTEAFLEMDSDEATPVVTCSVSTMQVDTGILIESGGDDRYRGSTNLNRESVLGLET